MSRSVDCLTGAQIVVYKYIYIVDWLRVSAPSLQECQRRDSRETAIILENGLCEIGMSEYCGLVSISIRPKEEGNDYSNITGIATKWIESIRPKFEKIGDLVKIGTFSNGEATFRRVEDKQLISSKEGVCQWA